MFPWFSHGSRPPVVRFSNNQLFASVSGRSTRMIRLRWAGLQIGPRALNIHRAYSKISSANLDFLLQNQYLDGTGRISQSPTTKPEPKNHDQHEQHNDRSNRFTILDLSRAVLKKNTGLAEQIFYSSDALQTSPKALRWMLRNYTFIHDFTTAKAFLLEKIDSIGSKGIYQFLRACFRISENAAHLEEVFWRASTVKMSESERAILIATAMQGFRILQDQPRFDKVRNFCHKIGLDRSPAVLQVQIYDHYIAQEFEEALQLGRVVLAKQIDAAKNPSSVSSTERNDEIKFSAQRPYRWVVHQYSMAGDIGSLDKILDHMRTLQIRITMPFTNTVLSYLPPLYPEISISGWFELCRERSWPLNLGSMTILVDRLAEWYPSIGSQIWDLYNETAAKLSNELPQPRSISGTRPADPQVHSRRNPFLMSLLGHIRAGESYKCIHVLDTMRRQGIMPPYHYYVLAFESIVGQNHTSAIDAIRARMTAVEYPLHCAGTDLSMLERHIPENNVPLLGRQLIESYLVQYPLSQHDRGHLTRLGTMLIENAKDPQAALDVVDFMRSQSPGGLYTHRNHDSASLQLVLRIRLSLNLPIDEWVNDILADKPMILLDKRFRQRLIQALKLRKIPHLPIMNAVRKHNESVSQQVLEQIELLANHLRELYVYK